MSGLADLQEESRALPPSNTFSIELLLDVPQAAPLAPNFLNQEAPAGTTNVPTDPCRATKDSASMPCDTAYVRADNSKDPAHVIMGQAHPLKIKNGFGRESKNLASVVKSHRHADEVMAMSPTGNSTTLETTVSRDSADSGTFHVHLVPLVQRPARIFARSACDHTCRIHFNESRSRNDMLIPPGRLPLLSLFSPTLLARPCSHSSLVSV